MTALWAERPSIWLLQGSGNVRVVGRDGDDITPEDLPDGAELTLGFDDGPIYLVGDISVSRTN